jgi:hypothetical protein
MPKLKLIYSLFVLAGLLFIAKPFLGFEVQESLLGSSNGTSVIVKAFSKRKPEYLAEAKAKKSAVSFQLNHPPVNLLVSILSFLALLFPLLNVVKAIRRFLANNFYNNSPIYILTGQLII